MHPDTCAVCGRALTTTSWTLSTCSESCVDSFAEHLAAPGAAQPTLAPVKGTLDAFLAEA